MSRFFILLFFFAITSSLSAQEGELWSLEKCILYAVDNSLQVQQASLSKTQAELNKKEAIWSQAPTINGSFRHGMNFGRSVDLTSYSFNSEPTQSSSISLNANMILFQGLQIRNTIAQSKVSLEAAEKDVEQAKNDVALSVAQAYLTILLALESKEVLMEQAKVTKAQYEQTLKLIEGGVLAENSKYDLEAQMARDEENIVRAQNSEDLAYVNLKTFMNIDISKKITIERTKDLVIQESAELASSEEIYQEAIRNQPSILAAKLRERSAELGVKIAQGALWPSLSFYGGVNTNFSSAARMYRQEYYQDTTHGVVTTSSEPVQVYSYGVKNIREGVIPYFDQLAINFTGNIGLNLSIPIFNGLRTRIGINRSRLGIQTAKLATTQLEVTLKSNIERSLTDVKAAEKRLAAANKSIISTRLSVENTRKRYNLGVVNSFELTSVQNTLISMESNLLQAKYDYMFKLKILDYYRGRAIQN